MHSDPIAYGRYRRLRILVGAIFIVVIAVLLSFVLMKRLTTWGPPGAVPIPSAPAVEMSLQDHPRLIAKNEAIEALSQSTGSPEYVLLMKKAEQFYGEYLDDPKQGDTIYPGYFALAYRISGDRKYLDAAKDMALNVARFPAWRRQPESSNFYKIELAYAVGIAYDLLYDEFSPSERKQIERKLGKVLDGLLWHIQGRPFKAFWVDAPNSNYYVAYHSAAGLLALCLGDAYPRSSEALGYAYEGLLPSIELLKKDEGWIEGLTYMDFAWGQHGLLFLNALRVNAGPNHLAEDWYSNSVRFALAGILPSGLEQANFGDNISDPIASWGYLWRARAFFDSPFLDDFLDTMPDRDNPNVPLDAILMESLLRFDPGLPLSGFPEPQACEYFPGIEWVTLRQDWTNPDGFYFAMKAGYGGWDHNHVDQGSFILAFAGNDFIADPGKGDFNERRKPEVNNQYAGPTGHSVFIPGAESNAGYFPDFTMYSENTAYRQADAKIVDFRDTPERTSFRLVLDGAYLWSEMKKWARTVVWLKPGAELPGGAVLIVDDADVAGQLKFISPYQMSYRLVEDAWREGMVFPDGTHDLGIWWWSEGKEIWGVPYRAADDLWVNPISDNMGNGLRTVFTVLLPWDEIARVVVEVDKREEPISIFVDGFLVEFRRDHDGNWQFLE